MPKIIKQVDKHDILGKKSLNNERNKNDLILRNIFFKEYIYIFKLVKKLIKTKYTYLRASRPVCFKIKLHNSVFTNASFSDEDKTSLDIILQRK